MNYDLFLRQLAEHTDTSDPTACWRWGGSIGARDGYGYSGNDTAHRIAYVFAHGVIPPGLEIDHLCRVRTCCNPAHLEAVTHRENVYRGVGLTAVNATKTECDYGHPFTPKNTYLQGGRRHCRPCNSRRVADYKAKRRVEQGDRIRATVTAALTGEAS